MRCDLRVQPVHLHVGAIAGALLRLGLCHAHFIGHRFGLMRKTNHSAGLLQRMDICSGQCERYHQWCFYAGHKSVHGGAAFLSSVAAAAERPCASPPQLHSRNDGPQSHEGHAWHVCRHAHTVRAGHGAVAKATCAASQISGRRTAGGCVVKAPESKLLYLVKRVQTAIRSSPAVRTRAYAGI